MESCRAIFHRREDFVSHLQLKHQVEDEKIIDEKALTCRVGRNGQDRFWCGFCRKLIELESRGVDAWNERHDHIERHFRMGMRVWDSWYPTSKDIPTT